MAQLKTIARFQFCAHLKLGIISLVFFSRTRVKRKITFKSFFFNNYLFSRFYFKLHVSLGLACAKQANFLANYAQRALMECRLLRFLCDNIITFYFLTFTRLPFKLNVCSSVSYRGDIPYFHMFSTQVLSAQKPQLQAIRKICCSPTRETNTCHNFAPLLTPRFDTCFGFSVSYFKKATVHD